MDKLYEDIESHILNDEKPSDYINDLEKKGKLKEYPLTMLSKLIRTEQSEKHHPEGNVWNHTMLVLDEAAKVKEKSSNPRSFMWAALLHDIGKAETTRVRKDKITAYDHDRVGAKLAQEFLDFFHQDTSFIKEVVILVKYHMYILYVVKDLPFADIKSLKNEANIEDVALLGKCDRYGRGGVDKALEDENIRLFLKKVKSKK
jgi:putative nucleotidyltransferase with HDIG domain